jgi:hypothetical protein
MCWKENWSFGVAPHVLEFIKGKDKKQHGDVFLFDESMNSELESRQMHVHLMFRNAFSV